MRWQFFVETTLFASRLGDGGEDCLWYSWCGCGFLLQDRDSRSFFYDLQFCLIGRCLHRIPVSTRCRHWSRTWVISMFVTMSQRLDSRTDAQAPDIIDEKIDKVALDEPHVTFEPCSYHQWYSGLLAGSHGPAHTEKPSWYKFVAKNIASWFKNNQLVMIRKIKTLEILIIVVTFN